MRRRIKSLLPIIGASFLLIITVVNILLDNAFLIGTVSMLLFLLIVILYFLS
ncbi:hypothetical protein [Bacillus alkalicellulosilyticus]|uniref:hypothetical protein n=1 Tax=Alkalihalobacterium alkalicellulosilyticum TaxID=1912214 RepID=UPI001481ED34|nr:hypothetical protein [Bacillus alkalicellulosilyticus]